MQDTLVDAFVHPFLDPGSSPGTSTSLRKSRILKLGSHARSSERGSRCILRPGTMDITEIILQEELEFPKLFASYVETGYGILFYNEDQKDSYDSNHAVLFPQKVSCLEDAIDEVRDFYLSKGIAPRIYSPLIDGYFEEHKDSFESSGYTIEYGGEMSFMLLQEQNTIRADSGLDIVRLIDWDDRIARDIFIPSGEQREIALMKNGLQSEYFYLFAAYLDGVAVAATYLHVSQHGCTRFDYIVTASEHRRRGYARALLSFVVDYCRDNDLPNCYQWPAHPTSTKICYEAGFREMFRREYSSAVYKESATISQTESVI